MAHMYLAGIHLHQVPRNCLIATAGVWLRYPGWSGGKG
jgi:hypothetical protein